jgi:hypothetical protein
MPALETLRNEPDIVHAVVIEAVIASPFKVLIKMSRL